MERNGLIDLGILCWGAFAVTQFVPELRPLGNEYGGLLVIGGIVLAVLGAVAMRTDHTVNGGDRIVSGTMGGQQDRIDPWSSMWGGRRDFLD